jgi:hypothetical protein
VQQGELFARRLPTLEPEFINLSNTDEEDLQNESGLFGWVLWLIQQTRRKEATFRDVLRQVVTRVDKTRQTNPGRWESLLWFTLALVYHARKTGEQAPLAEFICSTVRKTNQPEVTIMSKTIAEALIEKGAIEGRRDFFLSLLREKFKTVPEDIVAEVQATTDVHQFDLWAKASATARTLDEIPFKYRP